MIIGGVDTNSRQEANKPMFADLRLRIIMWSLSPLDSGEGSCHQGEMRTIFLPNTEQHWQHRQHWQQRQHWQHWQEWQQRQQWQQ
jgi:hypothetical protein